MCVYEKNICLAIDDGNDDGLIICNISHTRSNGSHKIPIDRLPYDGLSGLPQLANCFL